jgi:hypothetical protein
MSQDYVMDDTYIIADFVTRVPSVPSVPSVPLW